MKTSFYHPTEEQWNIGTHFVGFILSLVGTIFLAVKSIQTGNVFYIISFNVFGLSLMLLYLASTLYHKEKNEKKRLKLNIADHAAIYILIAGSYTPYTLITLQGKTGWWMFGISWFIAAMGVVFKLFFFGKYDRISTVLYVLMGWMVIFTISPLVRNLSAEGLFWLFMGGVFYTLGAVFYSIPKIKFNHAVFHFFVLFGSISHFISIYFYV